MAKTSPVDLFRSTALMSATGRPYTGRFTCQGVQFTGTGEDKLATFSITARELADAADGNLIWTDQDVQRGIRPEIRNAKREISLGLGYPDPAEYIFDRENADDIVEKLLRGAKVFLNPLIWNLRPDHFQAYFDSQASDLHIYEGKLYLPDSHHRQQAIVKAVHVWRDAPADYPKFDPDRQFKIELYFLSKEDEGNFFFDKNKLSTSIANSKGFDLSTSDALSLLAKRTIEKSKSLSGNINRVTDRLTSQNPDVMTLSTFREMMRTFSAGESIDKASLDGMAVIAAAFYDTLASVRPELGKLTAGERALVRRDSMADAAVMMHGYGALMQDFYGDVARLGITLATRAWIEKLSRLKSTQAYSLNGWTGDFFDRNNPLWLRIGLLKSTRTPGKNTFVNTGATRLEAGRILRSVLASNSPLSDLAVLAAR